MIRRDLSPLRKLNTFSIFTKFNVHAVVGDVDKNIYMTVIYKATLSVDEGIMSLSLSLLE